MTATGRPAMTMREASAVAVAEKQEGTAMTTPEGRTRIYRQGDRIAHLRHVGGFQQGPPCLGLDPDPESRWLGTGSQEEYEAAAALPLCGECAADAGQATGEGS